MANLTLDISAEDLGPDRGPVWVSRWGKTSHVTLRTDLCNLPALAGAWEEMGRPGLGSPDGSHSLGFQTSGGKKGTFLKLQAGERQGNVPGWVHAFINMYLLKYLSSRDNLPKSFPRRVWPPCRVPTLWRHCVADSRGNGVCRTGEVVWEMTLFRTQPFRGVSLDSCAAAVSCSPGHREPAGSLLLYPPFLELSSPTFPSAS